MRMNCNKHNQDVSKLLVNCCKNRSTKHLQLSLTSDGTHCFEQIPNDYKIVPVAVVGPGRTGKSSLLNSLIGKSVFQTGSTIERVPKGIWVYIDLKHDTKKAFMYCDVEGFGDTAVDEDDEKLLTIVCQVCDVIMYNTRDVYDKDMMEKMVFICTLFDRYRKQSQLLSKPIFALVLRDFSLDFPKSPDTELKQKLKACPGGEIAFQTFREVKLFPLVFPTNGGRIRDLQELSDEKLNEDFKTYYNLLKALVEEQAQPLRVNDSMDNPGRVVKDVVERAVKARNDEDLSGISQTLPENLKQKNENTKEQVKVRYKEKVQKDWPDSKNEENFIEVDKKYMNDAIEDINRKCLTVTGSEELKLEKPKKSSVWQDKETEFSKIVDLNKDKTDVRKKEKEVQKLKAKTVEFDQGQSAVDNLHVLVTTICNDECLEDEQVKIKTELNTARHDETIETDLFREDDDEKLEEVQLKITEVSSFITLDDKNEIKNIERGKRFYTVCLFIIVLLDVILLIGIIVAVVYMYSERKLDLSPDIALRLPCKDIQVHPDDVVKGILQKGKNNGTCCLKDTENYDDLMSYFVDHWLKEKLAKDERPFTRYLCQDQSFSGASKPSIKLVGRDIKQTEKHDNVLWDGRSDAAILSDNKDFDHHEEDGLIEIKKTGHYQIYSQVVFSQNKLWYKMLNRANIYQHKVIRIPAGRSENDGQIFVIMKASNTYCSCKTNNQTVTSYMNGAFQLSEGDRLAVRVRDNTEIVPVAYNNFFGIYMLY